MQFIKSKTGISIVILVGVFIFGYLMLSGVFGGTMIGLTLRSNPDLEDGLVGHWTFDGANPGTDSSVNGYDGELVGVGTSSAVTLGVLGQAFKFDGVDDRLYVGDWDVSGDGISLSAWARVESFNSDARIISKSDNYSGAGNHDWALIVGASQNARLRLITDEGFEEDYIDLFTWPLNEWHHITVTYASSTSKVRWYIDGEFLDSDTRTNGGAVITGSGEPIGIGNQAKVSAGDRPFHGDLDDVRVYDRALSDAEILRLYELGATTKIAKTITTNPDLKDGLVGHWTFDGLDMDIASNTAEVLDRSGSGYHGNWQEHATSTVPGKIGQGIDFDGVDDYVNTTYGDDFGSSDDFTIALWFKQGLASIGGDESLIGARNSGTNDVINIERDGDGSLCGANDLAIQIENGANDDLYCVPYGNSMDWTHLVASYNNNPDNFSAYINGELVTTGGIISDSTKSLSSYPFYIGAFNSNGTDVDHYTGQIDDVRFYNKALTADESKRLYGLGATTKIAKTLDSNPDLQNGLVGHWSFDGAEVWTQVTDQSGNGYTGYLSSTMPTTTAVVTGRMGQALNFDGVNDYIYIDNGVIPDCTFTTMTASVWVKGNVTPSAFDTFFACNVSEGGVGWDLYYKTSSQIDFYIEDYTSNFAFMTGVDGTEWHHVVGTWDGSTIRIYVDNVEGTSDSYAGGISNGKGIEIGRTGSNTYNFDGIIDDARLYNRVLSRDEIKRLYELGL